MVSGGLKSSTAFNLTRFLFGLAIFVKLIPLQESATAKDLAFQFSKRGDVISTSDSIKNASEIVETTEATLVGFGAFHLGFGHHDNLTEGNNAGIPKLKTSGFGLRIYGEGGIRVKSIYISLFISGASPIPMTKEVRGYKHRDGFTDAGLLLRLRVLSRRVKVNLIPMGGYKFLQEIAHIYDPSGTNPDSLYKFTRDDAFLYGLEFTYRLSKNTYEEEKLKLIFIRENLKSKVNKYRLEWLGALYATAKQRKEGIPPSISNFAYISLGFELVHWSDGRKDWFILLSFGLERKLHD